MDDLNEALLALAELLEALSDTLGDLLLVLL